MNILYFKQTWKINVRLEILFTVCFQLSCWIFFYILGSDDLSAKLWDVSTGQCIYGIQTHTCAAVKFDEQKLVTGSFDNTVACWEWSSGAKTQHFRGHTGAGMLNCSVFNFACQVTDTIIKQLII